MPKLIRKVSGSKGHVFIHLALVGQFTQSFLLKVKDSGEELDSIRLSHSSFSISRQVNGIRKADFSHDTKKTRKWHEFYR